MGAGTCIQPLTAGAIMITLCQENTHPPLKTDIRDGGLAAVLATTVYVKLDLETQEDPDRLAIII